MTRDTLLVAGVAAVLVLATAGAVAVGFGTADAQTTATPADRAISVSATGSADASPDQAVVHVAVTGEADDPATVRDTLATGAQDLRDRLDELGVEYETTEYAIEQRPERPPERRTDAPPYRGVHAFQVTLDDPDAAGDVIDAAVEAGAEVGHVELTLSDAQRETLREEAIRDAMADARSQATTIASAGDLTVTGVATVDAAQRHYSPVRYEMAAAASGAAAADTVVSQGEVSVSYEVSVTYNATDA
jgi:uncharacterized protein YggE